MIYRFILIILLYISSVFTLQAEQCSAVFPDGIQNNNNSGRINFGNGSKVTNSPDNILDSKKNINDSSGGVSCDTGTCSSSGNISAAINYATPPNSNNNISVGFGQTQTISPGNYENIILSSSATLNLNSGDYHLSGRLSVGSDSKINIVGSGVVRLFVKTTVQFNGSTEINLGGDATKLLIHSKDNFSILSNAQVTAFIYSKKNITINSTAVVNGAVSGVNVTLISPSTVNFVSTEPDFGDFCTGDLAGPIAEYHFDETLWDGSNNEVLDSSGNDLHGSAQNVMPTDGLVCNAAEFDGNNLIQVADHSLLEVGKNNADYSVSFWVKLDSNQPSGWRNVIHKGNQNQRTFAAWLRPGGDNRVHHRVSTTSNYNEGHDSLSAISADVWTLVTLVKKDNLLSTYLDGTLNRSSTISDSEHNNGPLYIGKDPWYAGMRGLMDELLIFPYALSDATIQSIKVNNEAGKGWDGSARDCPTEPVLNLRFDESSWSGAVGEVVDETGNFNGQSKNGADTAQLTPAIVGNPGTCGYGIFDGEDDYVILPNTFENQQGSFTLTAWVNPSNSDAGSRIFADDENNSQGYALSLGDPGSGKLRFYSRGVSPISVDTLASVIPINTWTFVTAVHNSATKTREIYVNGVAQTVIGDNGVSGVSHTYSGNWGVDTGIASIGGETDSGETANRFTGAIDEVRMYNSALSAAEINEVYQENHPCDDNCETGTLNAVGIKIGSGSNSQINTTTEALAIHAAWLTAGSPTSGLIDSGTYNVAASGESTVDRIDFGGSGHDFTGTLAYPGVAAGVGGSDFLVHTSGTLSLPAGTYTIYVEADDGFSFIMDTLSGDTVSFNKFGSSNSGQSNELRFENPTANSNTGGSFTLTEDSVFDIGAIFFERGGGDYLEISISNDIRSNAAPSGYEILKHGALGGKVKFGDCVDPSQIDHYQIIHDGNGLTCTAEKVIIKACTNTYDGTCTLSGEAVTIVVNTTGSDIATDTITFTGEGSANLAYTKSESTILSIEDASIIPASPAVCFDNSTTSCNLFFADTGFRFYENTETNPIPTQVSAKPSNTLKIQAIEKNPDTGACQATFIDTTTIEMAATCVDPIACAGSQVAINNLITTGDITTLDKNSALSYSSVNLDFSDDTVNSAEFIFTYPDAGKVQLHARYNIPDENGDPSGNYMLGSSNEFVVRPFGFFINVVDNPKAQSANQPNSVFKKAGVEFTTSLTAVQWQAEDDIDEDGVPDTSADLIDNSTTVNFGNETTPETAIITDSLYLPNLGVEGKLTNVDFTDFNDGIATNGVINNKSMTYDEVGIVNFTANLTSGAYLGASDVIGVEPYVGRFIPDHFELSTGFDGSIISVCDIDSPSSEMTFAYTGQMSSIDDTKGALQYESALQPELLITAKSSICPDDECTTTQNYTGDFIKFSAEDVEYIIPLEDATLNKVGSLGDTIKLLANLSEGTLPEEANGVITYAFNVNDNFVYLHEQNAEISPFPSLIELGISKIKDSDDVLAIDSDDDTDNNRLWVLKPTSKEIRFGRVQLENSYGPETSDLPQPLSVNYFKEGQYVLSEDDNCTRYDSSKLTIIDISLINFSSVPPLPDITSVTDKFINETPPGETRAIELIAPGTGNTGQVCVSYDIYPWLQYEWAIDEDNLQCPFVKADVDGLFNDNPRAVATFGIYRGNDRIIYQREISR
jgi:MSHA biogenesis protein MshQ